MNGRFILLAGIARLLFSGMGWAEEYPLTSLTAPRLLHLSLGSSTNEVIQVMGEPKLIVGNHDQENWNFGTSLIIIQDGRVHGWINSGNPNLPVFLGDRKTNAPPFQKGSSPDEVIATMGTPDSLTQFDLLRLQNWYYGASRVSLVDGKVESWQGTGLNVVWDVTGINVEKAMAVVQSTRSRSNLLSANQASKSNATVLGPVVRPNVIRTNPITPTNSPALRIQIVVTVLPKTNTADKIFVKGYTRKDGHLVRSHFRSKPKQ